ncbi:MAG: hypothetical protein D3905_10285 [Candidatus Electrothrix sp. AS4_5]|nr:hypothetical protein [Candidatus Electrothrix gigas]
MPVMLAPLLMVFVAYLVGSISTGYLLVLLRRSIDVRTTGSGSSGTRNVGRVLGRQGFYLTLTSGCPQRLLVQALLR